MEVVSSVAGFSARLDRARAGGRRIGLVPTMGALHAGHRSLLERASAECDCVAATIFVNPLQFGDASDLQHYPRTLDADLALCEASGVALALTPPVGEMYPCWPERPGTTVSVRGVAERWEGASRPGHFDGVATVVTKLFAMTGPCRAYFGEKDFQQLAVVRQLATDLSFPVEVVGCPTVREQDGLALSSRNARLSPRQRLAAPVLVAALEAGQAAVCRGERRPEAVGEAMAAVVGTEPAAALDYAVVVDPEDLEVPAVLHAGRPWRLLVAACLGDVRLIDNCEARVPFLGGRPGNEGLSAAFSVPTRRATMEPAGGTARSAQGARTAPGNEQHEVG